MKKLPKDIRVLLLYRHLMLPVLVLLLTACQASNSEGNAVRTNPSGASEERTMDTQHIRIATFNIAMGFDQPGEMAAALQNPDHQRLRQLAAILQTTRPDILLLNEFDYDPEVDAAALLNRNFLSRAAPDREPIEYAFHYRAESNTGIPSGLDIDGDGQSDGPADAWGFGYFPGQYGMLLLSRFPIDKSAVRSFRKFKWASLVGALRPRQPDGSEFYSDETWRELRLSSKSHWDVPVDVDGHTLHVLAFHPTPPVFDGPENRNGLRNHDEIRFWADYLRPEKSAEWLDDQDRPGGLEKDSLFVILGDINADPVDGDSAPGAAQQLLGHELIDASFTPASKGAVEASSKQGGLNREHGGNAAFDTADFNDKYTGNLRLDYVLPAKTLSVVAGEVFWPAEDEAGHDWLSVSDHRLVWLDLQIKP